MPEVTSYLQHLLATLCVRREADKEKFKVVAKVKLGTGTKASPLLLVVPAAAVVQRLAQLYSDLPSLPEVFEPHVAALGDLAKHASGAAKEKLQSALSTIRETIDANLKDRESLQLQQHKPVPIASFLPKFEESFNANKRYDPNRERQQLKKLQVQHKKEFKGAMREVRKDTQFVHRQRLQDIKSKDAAYKKKMDRIEGLIGREAGELKQAERKAARGK
jgi:nucleolar protein 14